jgi:hypothetical protein
MHFAFLGLRISWGDNICQNSYPAGHMVLMVPCLLKSALVRKKKNQFAIHGRELFRDEILKKSFEKVIFHDLHACVLTNLQNRPFSVLVWPRVLKSA